MTYYHTKYGGSRRKKKKPGFHRAIIYTLALLIIAAIAAAIFLYRIIYHPNVWLNNEEYASVYIPTASNFDSVKTILYSQGLIVNRRNFEWLAGKKKYPENVKPGHYIIAEGMSNDRLINMLRSGEQVPVKLIFNNISTIQHLAERVSQQIEADSAAIVHLLSDTLVLQQYKVTPATAITIFIPNTYELYWNTTAPQFIDRMYLEYKKFWDNKRQSEADSLNMTIPEVTTLASIVEKETTMDGEKSLIAAVYLNRLRSGWLLQADPTLKYALGDPGIRRILNEHKAIDSPYNTYKYGGLPPGPICIPSISSIDAVLNPDNNDYMYFCAKEDMSGYHNFSKTLRQHSRNARKYQEALNNLKIYK